MFSYKLNIQAEEDITRIFEYGLGRFGLSQAVAYYEKLFDCFEKITYCVCGVDTIFYKINGHVVEIMAIIGRQNYELLF